MKVGEAVDGAAWKAELKAYAHEIGIDLIGVASAEPFETDKQRLEALRDRGLRPSPFQEQDIEKRVNLDQLLPGVRSVIAVGINYLTPEDQEPSDTMHRGWISRYCRSPQDYHTILRERLDLLAAWLHERFPGCRTLPFVDTGPPLERAVAVRAGIGQFGKSTNLLTRIGTWVFLGELLTDIELPPDQPLGDACGRCTLCLDACPTGAFVDAFALENDRCLSYITQTKGYIPDEFRVAMGNRIFGCDDCQDVCPWNRRPRYTEDPAFATLPEFVGGPNLLQLLAMDNAEFRRTYKPTAAGWRGKTVLQRNALIALGNSGAPGALEPLTTALHDQRPVMRGTAAWALGRVAELTPAVADQVLGALRERREREYDPEVLHEIDGAVAMAMAP